MNKTIGILAHVDAGKTTFSEQLLYLMGSTNQLGQVNQKTSHLDTNMIERERGITIFSSHGSFEFEGNHYHLIDTPGHMDFSAEAERALSVLDFAILILSGTAGVEAHTLTLFRLLESYQIPVFFFLNKMDMEGASLENCWQDIRLKLTTDVLLIPNQKMLANPSSEFIEFICEREETLLDRYFSDTLSIPEVINGLRTMIITRNVFPCCEGSAISGESVLEFFRIFNQLTTTDYNPSLPASAFVYKVSHESGYPLTFLKVLTGTIKVKDSFILDGETEKINEIRCYLGNQHVRLKEAPAGTIVAVTGLKSATCGMTLGESDEPSSNASYLLEPTLRSAVIPTDDTPLIRLLECLKELECEEPMLKVQFNQETNEISLGIMGPIQLEVLEEVLAKRFSITVRFSAPQILYKETIAAPVTGYGHFEPLRHYAEVNLLLQPSLPGGGITYESQCHVDLLPASYQSQVLSHIYSRTHRGILTSAPLTDLHIILINGRAHNKHTVGGDFREAVYRAIRQGLEKAENILLEPWYHFEIYTSQEHSGRVMTDITKQSGNFLPPQQRGEQILIKGEGPVFTFMDYPKEFLSMTKGLGTITLLPAGYRPCHNPEAVIKARAYDKTSDKEHLSCSVFCSHGTSFVVNWDEAENYMHCLKDTEKILRDL